MPVAQWAFPIRMLAQTEDLNLNEWSFMGICWGCGLYAYQHVNGDTRHLDWVGRKHEHKE